ncbi:cytochrome b5 domain-containing protein [Tepidibacter aestuarii]|uniref:cytochrome b5 domain-containing protein n=1 Tax=Tepidibacter aestuarii TaxID=2925782 RepID=UPI0020C00D0C|nr:cytochrome b5 domain-containing protein [Tepidibacter aestuarii]CAH2213928.1 putative heme/steroid binding protein [Tepidibacter aestuarii]
MEKSLKIKFKIQKIMYLKQMVYFAKVPSQKLYYKKLLKNEINKLKNLTNNRDGKKVNTDNQRKFTVEELSEYDGSNGKPAYVAVNGIVYDLSNEITWGGGTHFGLYSGKDLTNEFMKCHGKEEILNNLPKVGVLKK